MLTVSAAPQCGWRENIAPALATIVHGARPFTRIR
jgi:hypothetical protein